MNPRIRVVWAFVMCPDVEDEDNMTPMHLVRLAVSNTGQLMAAFPNGNRWVRPEHVVHVL